ncbi:MAG: hydroxymyristoyl-ACP dehydratase [Treponema sp.]|nr:hydroxymyristoyl-ACP dehydratase [Treponema sp.]
MSYLKEEKIIKKTGSSVILEFSVPGSSDYFDGHFPGFPVLPAVAQVFIIMQYVSRFFGIKNGLSEIKRTKLINKIRPDIPLVLYLEKKENNILFKITSPNEETIYSAGTLILSEVL